MPTSTLTQFPGIDPVGLLTGALSQLLTAAIHGFASQAFSQLATALTATTAVPLGVGFDGPWRAMTAVAGLFAVPILLVGVTSEVLAGRPGQALRRGVALPLLVGPVLLVARALLALLVAGVQGGCALLVQLGAGGPGGLVEGLDRIRVLLGIATGPADPTGAGASLLVVLLAGCLAFIIWVELAVRAALLLLLAALVPLALAGLFWTATATWTRRLVECMAAVLLAPLVITMVLVLAVGTLTAPTSGVSGGIDQTAVALALLFLGTLGLPLTFRIVPHVAEAAALTGAGVALTRRASHGAARLAVAAPAGPATRLTAPTPTTGQPTATRSAATASRTAGTAGSAGPAGLVATGAAASRPAASPPDHRVASSGPPTANAGPGRPVAPGRAAAPAAGRGTVTALGGGFGVTR